MASQTNIANTSFLEDCISKKRSIRDVHETLDLYSQSTKTRQDPEFPGEEANSLQRRIKEIAAAFKATYRKDKESLEADLLKEGAFAEQLQELGEHYGPLLWGDAQSQASRYRGQQQAAAASLVPEWEWANIAHQDSILFYIRCWITLHVLLEPTSRKGKPRASAAARDHAEHVEHPRTPSAPRSATSSNLPFRAPEVPCMLSTTEASRIETSTGQAISHVENTDHAAGAAPAAESRSPTTPNKRKAPELQPQSAPGKLQKVNKGIRPREGSPRARNVYSIPQSPGPNFPSLVAGTAQRGQRANTCDTDRTWAPSRGMTVETETVCDFDDVMVDTPVLASNSLIPDGEVPSRTVRSPTAGPSGTYRNPHRQDSVIRPTTDRDDSHFDHNQPEPETHTIIETPVPIEICSSVSTPAPGDVDVSKLAPYQVTQLRHELFILLLSHLNSIYQFSPNAYEPELEERMNNLLYHFWLHDTEFIRGRLGDRFTQVQTDWQRWMSMRQALSDFQRTTGYSGNPGDDWREHLRKMDTVSHAKASIAYVEFQGNVGKRGDVDERFNDDLATVFDIMTQVDGCNGIEEFGAVVVYNEGLLGWFS